MEKHHIDMINNYVSDQRAKGLSSGEVIGNIRPAGTKGVRSYKFRHRKTLSWKPPFFLNESGHSSSDDPIVRVTENNQSLPVQIIDVQMGQFILADLSSMHNLLTWDLLSCTGIALKLKSPDGQIYLGLAHTEVHSDLFLESILKALPKELSVTHLVSRATAIQEPRIRSTVNRFLPQEALNETEVWVPQSSYSTPHGLFVTPERVTFLSEKQSVENQKRNSSFEETHVKDW